MPNALQIEQDALGLIQVYAPGEVLNPADASQAFSRLNDMIDSWSNESLTCYAQIVQSVPLIVNKTAYTIGLPGGDIRVDRPLKIDSGQGAAYIQDTNGNNYPVDIVSLDVWNAIGNRTQVNSNVPTDLYYDPQLPYGIINIFPVPNISWTLFFRSTMFLKNFPDLMTPIYFPPGYAKAIVDNLAVELAPYFPTAVLTEEIKRLARTSKANIKRTNMRENIAIYDKEIVSRAQYSYNIYRDT